MLLYQFRADWFTDNRSQPFVIKAPREWCERFIPLDEFHRLFGGYVLWSPPMTPTDQMPGEAIGVWGRRNMSRLRRILRERGARFTTIDDAGPPQPVRMLVKGNNFTVFPTEDRPFP